MGDVRTLRRSSSSGRRHTSATAFGHAPGRSLGHNRPHASPIGDRVDAAFELQRLAGNKAVTSLLDGRAPHVLARPPAAVQRLLGDVAAPTAQNDLVGNPVVGLKKGDGLNFGTSDLKPRVSILQGKLNEKMTAGLNPDGMFGPRTGRALQDFQESIGEERTDRVNKATGDALMTTKKEEPPEPVPPKPEETLLDPALEDRLDQIQLEYVKQLRRENQALVDLERDLRDEEKPSETLGDKVLTFLLEKAIETAVDSLFGGVNSTGLFFDAIAGGFLEGSGTKDSFVVSTIVEGAVNVPLEKMRDELTKTLKAMIIPENKARGSLELFIDTQRSGLFDATERTMAEFSSVKQLFRTLTPGPTDPPQDVKEYRVARAQDLHIAIRKNTDKARNNQYLASLKQYAAYRAQGDLKQPDTGDNLPGPGGTDVSKLKDHDTQTSVRGIMEIRMGDVDPKNPKQPIRVRSLRVAGLGARARREVNLSFRGKTIAELGFPRRVWDGNDPELVIDDIEVMLARNERSNAVQFIKATPEGRQWLLDRGDGNMLRGMIDVMDAADRTTVDQVESGNGLEGPD